MRKLPVVAATWVLVMFCFAGDKKPPRQLTDEEKQSAYIAATNRIYLMLKAPSTAHVSPLEEAAFSTGIKNSIDVRVLVDAQNSYGAMLRNRWRCRVWPKRPDGLYPVTCVEEGR